MGHQTASTPTAWLGTGMLYKVVIDRVAGVGGGYIFNCDLAAL